MKKKSLGMAIIIFAILAIALLVLFGGMSTKTPYDMTIASDTETYLLDDSLAEELSDAEKSAKYTGYLENTFADDIAEAYPEVKNVKVTLPEEEDAAQIEISLDLTSSLAEENLSQIAEAVATAVGSSTTEDIVIQDTEGTILYTK